MNFSSSTLDGELIVLRLPQEQKMLQSSRNKLFQGLFLQFCATQISRNHTSHFLRIVV